MSQIFGMELDSLTLEQATERVVAMAASAGRFHYVVTPNADHIINLARDTEFKQAYREASLTVADGWPVVLAARLLGKHTPERVAGSDLVPAVLSHASRNGVPLAVYVLGGLGDVPELAARRIERDYPGLTIAGYASPPFGFDRNPVDSRAVADAIKRAQPDLIVVGLGSPKQEKWVHSQAAHLPPGVAICAGATVDFLAGSTRRAPPWVIRIGMEWLYRLIQEPRRMLRRYTRVAVVFPLLFIREWVAHRSTRSA